MKVYLAGPITGLSYDGACTWRDTVAAACSEEGVKAYSPMRAKEALEDVSDLSAWDYPDDGPLSSRAMVKRDLSDVRRADVLLVNLIGATRVSVGTMVEIGYAHALNIPIIVAMEEGNIHKHIFVTEIADLVCPTLDSAIDWILDVLHL